MTQRLFSPTNTQVAVIDSKKKTLFASSFEKHTLQFQISKRQKKIRISETERRKVEIKKIFFFALSSDSPINLGF